MDSAKRRTTLVTFASEHLFGWESHAFYAAVTVDQVKRLTKPHAQFGAAEISNAFAEKKFKCRSVHRQCTNRPQVFHTGWPRGRVRLTRSGRARTLGTS